MKSFSRLQLALFALVLTGLSLHPLDTAAAQQPLPSDDEVNAIASRLYCPVCENTPLDVCPLEVCRQWRELIRQMLAEGHSRQEIEQYFVENYGARVLAAPPPSGPHWPIYFLPPAIFAVGLFLALRTLRTQKRKGQEAILPPSSIPAPGEIGDEEKYILRIEEELKKQR